MTCDDGQSVVVNPGTVTNQSRQAFVISSDGTISTTSILVINYLALTDGTDTLVLLDSAPGLTPHGLVSCTTDFGGGVTLVVRASSRRACRSYLERARAPSSRVLPSQIWSAGETSKPRLCSPFCREGLGVKGTRALADAYTPGAGRLCRS
jgi:hypothetical protein